MVQDLGVQLRERRASGRETFQFIEKTRIKHVIINEGFTMCNIVFYMAFILHNNRTKMTIAFKVQHLLAGGTALTTSPSHSDVVMVSPHLAAPAATPHPVGGGVSKRLGGAEQPD